MVERAKVACYRFEGAASHAVALYLPINFLTLRVVVKTWLARRKLYLIGLVTIIHLSIVVYSMLANMVC